MSNRWTVVVGCKNGRTLVSNYRTRNEARSRMERERNMGRQVTLVDNVRDFASV